MENNNILTINFTTEAGGRGRFTVNLEMFLPATPGNFKTFLEMVNRSDNPQENAKIVFDFLDHKRNAIIEYRDTLGRYQEKEKAQNTAIIKKYTRNLEALTKYYNFEVQADNEAVKTSKIDVITMVYNRAEGKRTIENRAGIRFKKYGFIFHAYKDTRTKEIHIIIPSCGTAIATFTGGITTAPAYITPETINLIKRVYAENKVQELEKIFLDLLETTEGLFYNQDILDLLENKKTEETTPQAETTPETYSETEARNDTPPECYSEGKPRQPYYIISRQARQAETTPRAQRPYFTKNRHAGILYHATPQSALYGFIWLYTGILARQAPPGFISHYEPPLYTTGNATATGTRKPGNDPPRRNSILYDTS